MSNQSFDKNNTVISTTIFWKLALYFTSTVHSKFEIAFTHAWHQYCIAIVYLNTYRFYITTTVWHCSYSAYTKRCSSPITVTVYYLEPFTNYCTFYRETSTWFLYSFYPFLVLVVVQHYQLNSTWLDLMHYIVDSKCLYTSLHFVTCMYSTSLSTRNIQILIII